MGADTEPFKDISQERFVRHTLRDMTGPKPTILAKKLAHYRDKHQPKQRPDNWMYIINNLLHQYQIPKIIPRKTPTEPPWEINKIKIIIEIKLTKEQNHRKQHKKPYTG